VTAKREHTCAQPHDSVELGRAASPWGPPPPHQPLSADQRASIADLYARVDALLADAARTCRACGKCCRFTPGGIVLFASEIELAYLAAEAGPPQAESREGAGAARASPHCLSDAAAWTCPYQRGDLCTARAGRLLGCRTYFCDAAARAAGETVHEDALGEIKRIAAGRTWWYGPVAPHFQRG